MDFNIPDYWGGHPMRVHVLSGRAHRPTVSLGMYAGSLHLGHHMSPEGARSMAAALLTLADEADGCECERAFFAAETVATLAALGEARSPAEVQP